MSETISSIECGTACSPKGSPEPSCGCSGTKKIGGVRTAKYGGGFIALCAICCAVPPALIALGLISMTTAALLSFWAKVAFAVLAVLGFGYLARHYLSKTR